MSSLLPDDYSMPDYDPTLDASPESGFDESSSGCYDAPQGDDWYVLLKFDPSDTFFTCARFRGLARMASVRSNLDLFDAARKLRPSHL